MQKTKKSDEINYYKMITSSNKNFSLRKRMVLKASENGVKPTAREFSTTAKTVRKWCSRFNEFGDEGLCELSRRPLNSPNKTSIEIEQLVVAQRVKTPGFGARRLVEEFELPVSHNVANRIIKAHGLIRKRIKKHHKKNDLRHIKAAYEPFTRFQMDTKYLNDLPRFWPQMKELNLPEFQYTIRELSTGTQFLSYSHELSKTYATLTVERFLKHLKGFDVDMTKVVIKTDLGTEFDGQTQEYRDESFHKTIENTGATHLFNPPSSPNFNADVETIHATIEGEFYEAEHFASESDFMKKATTYQAWYNIARKNSSKNWKSPMELLAEKNPKMNPGILLLHPIVCETLLPPSGGYDVYGLTENIQIPEKAGLFHID